MTGPCPYATDPCDICNGWGATMFRNDPQTEKTCGLCKGTGERQYHELPDKAVKRLRRGL